MLGNSQNLCRFQWRPKSISFFLAMALALSIYSSIDCRLMSVDLGFIPNEYTSSTIDFGLWSFESNTGSCVSHQEAHHTYSWAVAELEDSVWSWFANGDVSWSASRVFGVMGVLFGGVSLILALRNTCISEAILVDVILYASATALLCEASKLGVFFNCNLCQSPNYWYNNQTDTYTHSKSCNLGTSAFLSIGSLSSYLTSISMCLGYACRPVHPESNLDYYDEKSLQSWVHTNNNPLATNESMQQQKQDTITTAEQNDTLEMSDRSGMGMRNRKASMEALNGSRENIMMDQYGDMAGSTIMHRNSVIKRMDEMSAVSWDDAYD